MKSLRHATFLILNHSDAKVRKTRIIYSFKNCCAQVFFSIIIIFLFRFIFIFANNISKLLFFRFHKKGFFKLQKKTITSRTHTDRHTGTIREKEDLLLFFTFLFCFPFAYCVCIVSQGLKTRSHTYSLSKCYSRIIEWL